MKGYKCKRENPDSMFGDKYFWLFPNQDTALFMGNIKGTKKNAVREKCKRIR